MNVTTNASPNSAIQLYLRDMGKYQLLDREEERTLARRVQMKNDQSALDRLVRGNLRLVVKIAKDFWTGGQVSLMDLIQEGNLGLVRAARKFDPRKQVKFSYYASFWIKAYIHKYLMDNHRSVRIGTTQSQRKLFFNLKKTTAQLSREGIEPTPAAIAKRLEVPKKDVVEMQQRLDQADLSLNAPLRSRENEEGLDRLVDMSTSAEEEVEAVQMQALLQENTRQFKRGLDARDRAILDRRILADQPDTLQTLGDHFGISRERIRQLEKRIINQLKAYLSARLPDMENYMLN
ncbi:RNA polymerase sigma factor [Desulfosarcina ovata subsp. sediminis]|uniref:RNA polymerase sigma factor n=1 Tax=Desulfosarcina ovata subsp. sediminis TaxID=885957 RepID=A0A5K7ZUE3_9BACT|nr:RNA polymerase factor sigma-32 [Desulfosarcina ovata]BBO83847.1 RNA polymerase sigma factor [Desulfosarcina ovata subsp. sediminis]